MWLGQDGASPGSPGDVHVAIKDLPASLSIVGAVLTDAVRGTWIYRRNDNVAILAEGSALPLVISRLRRKVRRSVLRSLSRREQGDDDSANDRGGRTDLLVRFRAGAATWHARRQGPSRAGSRRSRATTCRLSWISTGRSFLRREPTGCAPLVLDRPVTVTSEEERLSSSTRLRPAPGRRPSRSTVAIPRSTGSPSGSRAPFDGTTRFRGGRP